MAVAARALFCTLKTTPRREDNRTLRRTRKRNINGV
jgi:hypothetical protein